jgi:hypothetical protein
MKKSFIILLVLVLLTSTIQVAHAGFVRHKPSVSFVEGSGSASSITANAAPDANQHEDDGNRKVKRKRTDDSGWAGITAFVCGLAGLGILAIIFGAIGMGEGRKHRGLARAGFILGIVNVAIFLLIFSLLFFG